METAPDGLAARAPNDAVHDSDDAPALIADDGQTLWMSPTRGGPLDVGYLPPGVQIVIALRPRALLEHPEGEKVLAALGPTGQDGVRVLEDTLGIGLRDIDRLTIGCRTGSAGDWQATFVASLGALPAAAWKHPPPSLQRTHAGEQYWLVDDRGYWLPDGDPGNRLVVAPAEIMAEVMELAGSPPPLRRDIERLVAHTDADRHTTVLIAPNFLFSEGKAMFAGHLSGLRAPLFWFLGDEFSAAGVSLHWDENFFVELVAVPTLDTRPERAAALMAARLAEIPERVELYVLDLQPTSYSRRVLARLPAMVRILAAYTRSGFTPDHVRLRSYLPAAAGHNLLMGAELALAEGGGGAVPAVDHAGATPQPPATVADKLQQPISLRFRRDTLEAALQQIASDIGVELVIVGRDLEVDGITKNQSFGIDIADRPAKEVLVEVLRRANPDPSATGPADERQKLVYVVQAERAGGPEAIHITTRARAAERGDVLPAVFVAE